MNIEQIIENSKLTTKAKDLYELNLYEPLEDVTELDDSFKDVTHKKGFNGYKVFKKENELYLVKSEDDEGKSISFSILKLNNVTDENLTLLKKIYEKDQSTLYKILFYATLVLTALASLSFIISIGMGLASIFDGDTNFFDLIVTFFTHFVFLGILAALSAKLVRK